MGGKPTGKFSQIYAFSESEDETLQSPASKAKVGSGKTKEKPTPKRRKIRDDSSDSMASRDDFVKPQQVSNIADLDSLSDLSLSEDEAPKVNKIKKRKAIK